MAGRGSPRERNSDTLELGDSPFVSDVAGIQRRLWFEQDDVDFLVSGGAVLDAARDDDKIALVDDGFVGAGLHPPRTFYEQKQIGFVVMIMPDENGFLLFGFVVAGVCL